MVAGSPIIWANTNCDWLIEPPDAKLIVLQFNSFKTRHDSDFVTVYDGDTTTAKILGTFSGDSIPPNLTATSGKMLIAFTSIGQDMGWDATYYTTATGINELKTNNEQLTIYPNPVQSVLNIHTSSAFNGEATVNIYNITGQKLLSKTISLSNSTDKSINLSDLNSGMYLLEILNNSKSVRSKIIKL